MKNTTENKYLTFVLDKECYAIAILKVKEIIGLMDITPIPRMPSFIKGVINLRGKIIPVIDLRTKLGLSEKEYNERTCIIVTEVASEKQTKIIGVVVDTVSEVLTINSENVEASPSLGGNNEVLNGLGKVNNKVIMLLNSDRILSSDEIYEMNNFSEK